MLLLPKDVWNDATMSSFLYVTTVHIRDLALKVICIIIGTLGVLDNLIILIIKVKAFEI